MSKGAPTAPPPTETTTSPLPSALASPAPIRAPRHSRYRRRASLMRAQPAKLLSKGTSAGSPWISTASKKRRRSSLGLRDPLGPERAHHVAHRARRSTAARQASRGLQERQQFEAQPRAAEGKLLGDHDIRRLGAEQAEQASVRSRWNASSTGRRRAGRDRAGSRRRAQRRQLVEARPAQRQALDRRAARDQQHVEAAGHSARASTAARRRWPMPSRCCTWKKTRLIAAR